jgi:predicted  nucleic acid-binding Zn-ribbon protein
MASEVDAQKHMSEFFRLATSLMTDPSTAWIEQVLKDNDAMKASLEQQEKEVEVIGKLLGKLHNELKLEAEKAELAVSQSEEAKTKASDLTTEMDAAKKSITEKDEQIQQNIAMISDLQTKLEARDQEIEACRQKVKEYENQRAKEVAAFKRQGQQIQSMRGELVSKTSQIEEFKQLSCELVTASRESM